MNIFKKALYIGFGVIFITLGLCAAVIFLLVNNLELGIKIIYVSGGLVAAIFGWWLLRRGSNSVWDALDWLFAHIIP